MDQKLAEIYGTNQVEETDLEKMAAAQLAENLSQDDASGLEGLSEEDLEQLAKAVLEGQSEETEIEAKQEETPEAPKEEPAGEDQETQEKVAEADYLGRVMAHAYVQELRNIEKTAGVGQAVKNMGQLAAHGAKKAGEHVMAHKGKLMGAGAAAAAGGAGYALGKHMGKKHDGEKQASALDTLASARAAEILSANGIDPETLQPVQEKTSSGANEALAQEVDKRAVAMLGELGFELENK